MPVYFIRWSAHKGPIKIGWTDNVEDRLAQIQAMSPVPLIVLNTLDCELKQEGAIHSHFAHLRLHGEWFKPEEELLRFVENPYQVIDRRPVRFSYERRPCAGFVFDFWDRELKPCTSLSMKGDDYCARCSLKTPKGMPKAYLDYINQREQATNDLISKWQEFGLVP